MLKIVIKDGAPGAPVLDLEGQVVGPWVEELDRVCEPILARGAGLSLDLSSVSFISREGVELLCAPAWSPHAVAELLALRRRAAQGGHAMSPDMERRLIERLRAQDPSVLEILMERYGPRLYRVAFGITRSHGDAEEVVQDVFLTLFRKIDSFEGRAALGTWLYRVASNASLIKRRGKRAELEVKLEDYLPTFKADGHREGDRALLLADWSQTPEDELLSGEAREILDGGSRAAPRALPSHPGAARRGGAAERGGGRDPGRVGVDGEVAPAPGPDGAPRSPDPPPRSRVRRVAARSDQRRARGLSATRPSSVREPRRRPPTSKPPDRSHRTSGREPTMRAIAVLPGKPDSVHLADLPKPSIDDVPGGRGVLVKVLRVGVDGTDKEINAAEYGAAPDGYRLPGHRPRGLRPGRGGRGRTSPRCGRATTSWPPSVGRARASTT